jgi:hypothetical protein
MGYYCHPSPELRTSMRALLTKARISSSKALRSCSETVGSPRLAAVATRSAGRANSSSSSCRISGCESVSKTKVKEAGEGAYGGVWPTRGCYLREIDDELLVRVAHPVFSPRMRRSADRMGH